MRYYIFIAILFFSTILHAHQPDVSSTVLSKQADGSWILQVKAALTAFEYEVETHNGKDSYDTPQAFQQLVIQHLQKHISIKINGKKAILQDGEVQLGHETNALFRLSEVPTTTDKFEVANSSFSDIHHNQSALVIIQEGLVQQQFILNAKNKHTMELSVVGSQLVPITKAASSTPFYSLLFGGVFVLLLVSYFVIRRIKQKGAVIQ